MAASGTCVLSARVFPGAIAMILRDWKDAHHIRHHGMLMFQLMFNRLRRHAVDRHDSIGESRQNIQDEANTSHRE